MDAKEKLILCTRIEDQIPGVTYPPDRVIMPCTECHAMCMVAPTSRAKISDGWQIRCLACMPQSPVVFDVHPDQIAEVLRSTTAEQRAGSVQIALGMLTEIDMHGDAPLTTDERVGFMMLRCALACGDISEETWLDLVGADEERLKRKDR